ncbi:MAG TPA: hypothetical protein VFE32_04100 [Puia sp.]|jgi:hypothetical protein|nr:hypothetical protein [Puia sp.]
MENIRFRGPHLGILAVIFTVLFIAGLSYVITFTAGVPHYPNPYDPAAAIVAYFREHAHDAQLCAFFQFASAIPLGIFTVTAWTRLRWLGVKAAGPSIALFGGLLTTVTVCISSLTGWTLAFPGVAADDGVVRGLYFLSFAIGGVGYSVPMGLLIAGIAVPAGFMRLLPRWMVVAGVILGLIGESSTLALLAPKLTLLIPLTRFPGFIWLMIAGFMLARRKPAPGQQKVA